MTQAGLDPRIMRTRDAVLGAARAVLLEEGWEHVTIGRVAERSGYGRATLYRHWPNRLDLLRDAIAEEARLTHSVPTGDTRSDLIAELMAFRHAVTATGLGHMAIAIAQQARTDPTFRELHEAMRIEGSRVLREIVDNARRHGELSPAVEADRAVGMLVGPLLYQYLFDETRLDAEYVVSVVDGFLTSRGF